MPSFVSDAITVRVVEEDTSVEKRGVKNAEENLQEPNKKAFAEALMELPFVGLDSDFERIRDN